MPQHAAIDLGLVCHASPVAVTFIVLSSRILAEQTQYPAVVESAGYDFRG
jgi:hypothetical protein